MVNRIFKKIIRLTKTLKREFGTSFILNKLEKSTDKDLVKFASAIKTARDKNLSTEEALAYKLIDSIRLQFLNSTENIVVDDFGAGNPNSVRTKEQIISGVREVNSVSSICKNASTPTNLGRLLFNLIIQFKPQSCLELGTSLGISASYQVLALQNNGFGRFITVEGSRSIADIAQQTIGKLGYSSVDVRVGKFNDVLPEILPSIGSVDFVFIDGHHDRFATKQYFEIIFPYLSEKSIVIFDDIDWSKGMGEFWREMHDDSRVKFSFDLYRWGICFIDKQKAELKPQLYRLIV